MTESGVASRYREALEVNGRTVQLLDRRARTRLPYRRGWLLRRLLVLADVVGLTLGFVGAELLFLPDRGVDALNPMAELLLFVALLPLWVLGAKLFGLYERDEERTDHSTTDDLVRVFLLVTVGAWVLASTTHFIGVADPDVAKLTVFWALAITLITLGRTVARGFSRRRLSYLQNTVVVGAGNVGQLVARKYLQHPEYGINLVGFVDEAPKERREDLGQFALLGRPDELPEIVRELDVERVLIAFSNDSDDQTISLVRAMRELNVQVDIVPRLFDVVGPTATFHTVEGLPLIGLPPARIGRSSRLVKRALDVVGATIGLVVTAPLFALVAWRIKRDSPGPVFFRQVRLGMDRREFTALKFRTMKVDTPEGPHREYIEATMSASAAPRPTGLYKLDREDAVTPVGRWLRKTSLDELPQLINVLRGEMSLVGPRPCLAYETEYFAPHHFDRFLVPAGITGLWQVTARANSTFAEALDMDAAYARSWSLGLDIRLLCRTPLQVLRQRGRTA